MPRISSIQRAKDKICGFFDDFRPRAFRVRELHQLIETQRANWALAKSSEKRAVIELLQEEGKLREVSLLPLAEQYRPERRYIWDGCTPFEIAMSIRKQGYLSHGSAIAIHALNEQIPRTHYINQEQSPKPSPKGDLTQASVDRAFRSKQRTSKLVYQLEKDRYVVLSGKNSGNFGVIKVPGRDGTSLRVSNLERTLVDSVVRPVYAGGIVEVFEAFVAARDRISSLRLLETLQALHHVYPYHQAIGFLMERAGFSDDELTPFSRLPQNVDFYLTHGMSDPKYSAKWQIFYPSGFGF